MYRSIIFGLFLNAGIFCSLSAQTPFVEKIDRGVVALTIDGTHAYVGWRLLKSDPAGISFNVYRKEVAPRITNWLIRKDLGYNKFHRCYCKGRNGLSL